MKKIISLILAMFIGLLFTLCITPMTKASAGHSDFIVPLFSGYVEDASKANITKHSNATKRRKQKGVCEEMETRQYG